MRARVRGTLRRVGNSLALIIPARDARRARLQAGQGVAADIEPEKDDLLGFLADAHLSPYRRREVVGPDRY